MITYQNYDYSLTKGLPTFSSAVTGYAAKIVYDATNTSRKLWVIDPNPWGVQSASGFVSINYTGNGKVLTINQLSNIVGSFGGYAEVLYGRKPWGDYAGDQGPAFPVRLSQLQELVSDVNYTLVFNTMNGNVAYDLWLTDIPDTINADGSLEVMIWLWRQNQYPAGTFSRSVIMPVTVNGNTLQRTFNVYVGGGSWTVVSFLLADAQKIQSGDVALSLYNFTKYGAQLVGRSLDSYLQGIEFGTEYTQANQNYNFTISKFDIEQTLR